jgi:hypothetical protein
MLYGLTHPLGTVIFCYILARSMAVTLWRGGVFWRDTFYPLEHIEAWPSIARKPAICFKYHPGKLSSTKLLRRVILALQLKGEVGL